MKNYFASTLAAVLLLLNAGCRDSNKKDFWIYTSTYKEVIALYMPAIAKDFPDVNFHWFQSGSENVAAKITAELAGGSTQADMLMTSDLFFFMELKKQGAFLALEPSPALDQVPKHMVDPDRAFVVSRFPVMVIAYNRDKVAAADRPTGFKSLLAPKYKGKLTMPSPLESGTALTTVLYLKNSLGADYFKGLRANDMLSSGGNGAAFARILSGERPIGLVLMENVLLARERGQTNVEFIVPEEGALPMPSPIAAFKSSKDPVLARRVIDWFLSPVAQQILMKGAVYSPLPGAPAPKNAPSWETLKQQKWDLATFDKWGAERQSVKELFQNTVLK